MRPAHHFIRWYLATLASVLALIGLVFGRYAFAAWFGVGALGAWALFWLFRRPR